ncbi:MAG: hypothetical protein R3B69_04480 [Candidatus Paceibacterota bacterium]
MLATATIATAAEEEVEILFGPPHFIDYLVPVESIDPKVVTPRMDTLSPFDEESGHGPLILEGMKTASGPNFAGSYLYLQMPACGTGMTCAVIVNLRDGAIIEVPAGDTGHDFRAQSNLFVTATFDFSTDEPIRHTRYFVLKDNVFSEIYEETKSELCFE